MKRKIISIFMAALLVFSLAACSGPSLVGKWAYEGSSNVVFEFFSDGTCKIPTNTNRGKWSLSDDGVLEITGFGFYGDQSAKIEFIDNDTFKADAGGTFVRVG